MGGVRGAGPGNLYSHQRDVQRAIRTIGPEIPNCSSKGSVPEFLRKLIATCDL